MTTTTTLLHADIGALLPRLRRFARILCTRRDDADDLVQVALERALQRSAQWQPGTRLDSWIFHIMKDAWSEQSRGREPGGAPEEAGGRADGPAEARRRALRLAIGHLGDEQRLVLGLVLVEGLPYQEAAGVLGVPVASLTRQLALARLALHGLLPDQARKVP